VIRRFCITIDESTLSKISYMHGSRNNYLNSSHPATHSDIRLSTKLSVVHSLIIALIIWPSPGQSKEGQISAYSSDRSNSDADKVFLEKNCNTSTVVVEQRRGIGSARIEIMSRCREHIYVEFRGFTRLENLSVRSGDRCIEAALGLPATRIGNWVNGRCVCFRSKSGTDILNMRVHDKSVVLEIPADLVRSSHSQELSINWINEYRQ